MKKILVNLLLIFFSTVLTLIAADILLRRVLHVPPPPAHVTMELNSKILPSKRFKPGLHERINGVFGEYSYILATDSRGFRISAPCGSNPEQDYRIVFLGDSHTASAGVENEKTFVSLIGSSLNQCVLNAGCNGYNTVEESQLLQQILGFATPKTVVVCFSGGNDPYENYYEAYSDKGTSKPVKPVSSPLANFKQFLKVNSSIYNMLVRLRRFEWLNSALYRLGLVQAEKPQDLLVYRIEESELQDSFWHATESALLSLRRQTSERNIELILLYIPDKFQVDDAYWRTWLNKYRMDGRDFDRRAPNKRLHAFCDAQGLPFLDTTDALFESKKEGRDPYWRIDHHLNGIGHQVVAKTFLEWFQSDK